MLQLQLIRFIKKLRVLYLVSSQLDSKFSQYFAGFRHILGIKVVFASPQEISFDDFVASIASPNSSSVNHKVSSGSIDVRARFFKAYEQSLEYSYELKIFSCKNALVSQSYPFHDSLGYPFWGVSATRGYLLDASSYPCGYPYKISFNQVKPDLNEPRAVFVPYLFFNHFGHALTEVASSIYPLILLALENFSCLPITVIVPFQFRDYAAKLGYLLGDHLCRVVVPGIDFNLLKVDELYCPKPTYVLSRYVSPSHQYIVKALLSLEYNYSSPNQQSSDKCASKKVYVSRSRLGPMQRHWLEEERFESLLRDKGWLIYHPQEHAIQHQLSTYHDARVICGLEGSAMHLMFGVNTYALKKAIILAESSNNDFALQFSSQNVPFSVIDCLARDSTLGVGTSRGSIHVRLKNNYSVASLIRKIAAETPA